MDDSSILYRHFDAHGRLLYVGVAVNPKKRLLQHASAGANWVRVVASTTYARFRTYKEVLSAEIKAIKNEAPLWNIAHADPGNSGRLRSVRIAKVGDVPSFTMPSEPCFTRGGDLVSFRTHGRAEHRGQKRLNQYGLNLNYHAVLAWMEWFSFHYENGCVTSDGVAARI